jgi:hypothetical protein
MKTKIRLRGLVVACGLCFALAGAAAAQETSFGYQGLLTQAGGAVDGAADFNFTLWDAEADGNMVGSMVAVTDVTMNDGVFSVQLDFGSEAFNGDPRYIETQVRHPAGDGEFTTLEPRQRISSVPYAVKTRSVYATDSGNVGIGTTSPVTRLHVAAPVLNFPSIYASNGQGYAVPVSEPFRFGHFNAGAGTFTRRMYIDTDGDTYIGDAENGGTLTIRGATSQGDQVRLYHGGEGSHFAAMGTDESTNFYIQTHEGGVGARGNLVLQGGFPNGPYAGGNVGIGTRTPQARLDVNGTVRTHVLTITGGSDIAEPFNVRGAATIEAGMLVAIDPDHAGDLRLTQTAYDRAVAGVISGAGGINPGMTLSQDGTIADGRHPVALTGRVYCYVDADAGGAVRPGDLLTSSGTPGHAMRVSDHVQATGAIVGKAMTSLESGRGLVLVLVNLH